MKTLIGDLFDPQHNFEVILHGCNCFHTMGAGVARQVAIKFPEAILADKLTGFGDKTKMGNISFSKISDIDSTVVNMYTQFEPGKCFDIKAFEKCLEKVRFNFYNKRIGMPMVGAGIGGGDWNKIEKVIEKVFKGMDVTVVKL